MNRNAWALLGALLLAGCASPPPTPSPDPIQGGLVREGRLAVADPAVAAFCVSQAVPLSVVVPVPDGSAVRPAPGTVPVESPDYAVTLRHAEPGAGWRMQVGAAGPDAMAVAGRLSGALADCAALLASG